MTREEVIKMLANTKVYVQGKSKEIQEKLFSLVFQWKFDGKKVCHEEKPFLFLWEDMELSYGSDMERFTKKAFREITANDILNIIIDEPKYRPFKNAEECWQEMQKHQPFGYIVNFDAGYYSVVYISEEGISFCNGIFKNYEEALNEGYRFNDGSPFGIKEEES